MPRLLLVDDNPSIHKIAETLLTPTDIELVCVESAKDALNLIALGEHFDVALIDTAMPELDGWGLLKQLRMHPATAGIPIAMMAGVLDTVDPSQIEHPSIQGFLKKPVELRDLGTRVHALLLTPVVPPEPPAQDLSPFSTMPGMKLSDLTSPPPAEIPSDVLVLEESDLWPESPVVAGTRTEDLSPFSEIPPEEHLDLEEFDLDGLKNLVSGTAPAVFEPTPPEPEPEPEREPELELEAAPIPSAFELFSEAPAVLPENEPTTQELPDLGPESEPTLDHSAFEALDSFSDEAADQLRQPVPLDESPLVDSDLLSDLGESSSAPEVAVIDWSEESEPTPDTLFTAPAFVADHAEPAPETLAETETEIAGLDLEEAPSVPEPIPAPSAATPAPDAEAILQALLANPVLLDQVAKAVVAKLSDQVLREIAWEVMPELAERLNRH